MTKSESFLIFVIIIVGLLDNTYGDAEFVSTTENDGLVGRQGEYDDLQVRPTDIKLVGPLHDVVEDTNIMLQCLVSGARPAANITWFIDTQELYPTNQSHYAVETNIEALPDATFNTISSLIFKATRFENRVEFKCKADNIVMRDGGERLIHDALTLEVMYRPIVFIQPDHVIVNENGIVLLICHYIANPESLTSVQWFKTGEEIELNSATRYKAIHLGALESNVLIINNVTRHDIGNYTCKLNNSVGEGESNNAAMVDILQYIPIVSLTMSTDLPVIENNLPNVTLNCNVVGGNQAELIKVRWYLDGLLLKELISNCNEDIEISDHILCDVDINKLLLQHVTRDFWGNYSCKALNAGGWSERSNEMELVVYYEPSNAVLNHNPPIAIKRKSVIFTCSVGDGGHPNAPRYRWFRNGMPVMDVTTPMWIIDPVGLDSRANFSCFAYNEGGNGIAASRELTIHTVPTFIQKLPPYTGVLFSKPQISLTCRVECYPECQIKWFKDGVGIVDETDDKYFIKSEYLPADPATGDFESAHSILNFNMSAWSGQQLDVFRDNANYSCVSTGNHVGPGIRSTTYFAVEYRPVNITVSPSDVAVQEGTSFHKVLCLANAFPEPTFEWHRNGRAIARGNALSLNHPMHKDDAGTYTCTARNRHGAITTEIFINITHYNQAMENDGLFNVTTNESLTTLKPEVSNQIPFEVRPTVNLTMSTQLPVMENESTDVKLYCNVIGGDPTELIEVRWYSGWFQLTKIPKCVNDSNKSRKMSENFKCTLETNTLLIQNVNRNNSGKYSCAGLNAGRWSERSNEEELIVHYEPRNDPLSHRWRKETRIVKPAFLKKLPPHTGALFSTPQVSLACRVECYPECEIQWFKNNDVIDDEIGDKYFIKSKYMPADPATGHYQSTLSILRFNMYASSGREFDILQETAKYSCATIRNGAGPGVRSSTLFAVEYPPFNITVPSEMVIRQEGSMSPIILCSAKSYPAPSFKWRRNNKTIAKEKTLILNNPMQRTDAGLYTCTATNRHGAATTEIFISVTYKPDCSISRKVIDGRDTLICTATDGNPTISDFTWSIKIGHNGNYGFDVQRDAHHVGDKSYLILDDATTEDLKTYRCVVNNTVGGSICDIDVADGYATNYYKPQNATLLQYPPIALHRKSVTLMCFIDDFNSSNVAPYRWFRNGIPVKDVVKPKWILNSVDLDSRTNFSCAANGITAWKVLIIHAKPSFIQKLPPYTGALVSTSQVALTCRIECYPECQIGWFKDGVVIDDQNDSKYFIKSEYLPADPVTGDFESAHSILNFNMSAWPGQTFLNFRDNANYSCVSTRNDLGPGVRSTTYFGVGYPPVNITVTSPMIVVQEGSIPPKVFCSAKSYPAPSFQWHRNGKMIEKGKSLKLGFPLRKTDAGIYSCTARNSHGAITTQVLMNVTYKPGCLISRKVIDGKDTLICTATVGNPSVFDFMWSIKIENDDNYMFDAQWNSHQDGSKSFLILDETIEETKTYRCVANNTVDGTKCEIDVPALRGSQFRPTVNLTMSTQYTVTQNQITNVTLYCNVVKGDELTDVRWYLDGFKFTEIPNCEVDGKGGRAILDDFMCVNENNKLVLQSGAPQFSGNYSCAGLNAGGWSRRSNKAELTVYNEPENTKLVAYLPIPIKRKSVTLVCSANDGDKRNATQYRWLRNGIPVNDVVTQMWIVGSPGLDSPTNFSCLASYEADNEMADWEKLTIHTPPSFIQKLPLYIGTIFSTPQISLSCRVECCPECYIEWFKDGVSINDTTDDRYFIKSHYLPVDPTMSYFESAHSILNFNMSAWPGHKLDVFRDNTNYSCGSTHNNVGPGVLSTVVFAVEYPPVNITVNPEIVVVQEGAMPRTVLCIAKGYPEPTFEWLRNGEVLTWGNTLIINQTIQKDDAGMYTCRASNRHGAITTDVFMNVTYKPIGCSISYKEFDDEDILICTGIDGNPSHFDFTWSTVNENDVIDWSYSEKLDGQGYIKLHDATEDKKTYQCIVKNSVGIGSMCEFNMTDYITSTQKSDTQTRPIVNLKMSPEFPDACTSVILSCNVGVENSINKLIKVRWYLNGSRIENAHKCDDDGMDNREYCFTESNQQYRLMVSSKTAGVFACKGLYACGWSGRSNEIEFDPLYESEFWSCLWTDPI